MFGFENNDDQTATYILSGGAYEAVQDMAEILEIDEIGVVLPLMVQEFHKILLLHSSSEETLREVVIRDSEETMHYNIFDIEELKIRARKMEIQSK